MSELFAKTAGSGYSLKCMSSKLSRSMSRSSDEYTQIGSANDSEKKIKLSSVISPKRWSMVHVVTGLVWGPDEQMENLENRLEEEVSKVVVGMN